jgi:hypothetical protein
MIHFRTQGGFCNRLQGIISAVLWAEDFDEHLMIYWPVEPGHMACSMEELIDLKSIPRFAGVSNSYLNGAVDVQTEERAAAVLLAGNRKIEGHGAFHKETYKTRGLIVLRALRFNRNLEIEASARWSMYSAKSSWTVIHFRGTDHKNCLAASPLSLFKEYLDSVHGSSTTFMLFSDEMNVKKELCLEYPNVKSCLVSLGRDEPHQQRMGVVEWLMMQKGKAIIASSGSSYSQMAAARSGATLITLRTIS